MLEKVEEVDANADAVGSGSDVDERFFKLSSGSDCTTAALSELASAFVAISGAGKDTSALGTALSATGAVTLDLSMLGAVARSSPA